MAYFVAALTTSRLRPLSRRRLRTLRPALVLIRLRNPCSLFRLTLLGWYVRFTAMPPVMPTVRKSARPKH